MRFILRVLALLIAALPATAEPLRIAVISDLNGSYGSTEYGRDVERAVAHIAAASPDLVIVTGDMVAGQRRSPVLGAGEIDAMWAAFHDHVTDPLTRAGIRCW